MAEIWQFLTTIGTIIGTGAGAAWWLKGQLSGAEMAGLREQNKAHEVWRGLAEAQTKIVTDELTAAKAMIENMQVEISEGASKETLAGTASEASGAVASALVANAILLRRSQHVGVGRSSPRVPLNTEPDSK
jgi:hypothetical protein